MQQTEKYGFNLIDGGDDFSPVPLNENMEKVEEELGALNAGQVRFCVINYEGDGEITRTHTFPFVPEVVVFIGPSDYYGNLVVFQGQYSASRAGIGNERVYLTWDENTLTMTSNSTNLKDTIIFNKKNYDYYMLLLQ